MTVTLARLGAITVNPVLSLSQVYAYKIFTPVPLSDKHIHIYIYIYTGVNARYTVGINRKGLATKSLEPETVVCRRSRNSQERRDAL